MNSREKMEGIYDLPYSVVSGIAQNILQNREQQEEVIGLSQYTSADMDNTTADRFYGDLDDIRPVMESILNQSTPFLSLLSSLEQRGPINSTDFKAKFDNIILGDPYDGLFVETKNPTTTTTTITQTINQTMLLGGAIDLTTLAQHLAVVPSNLKEDRLAKFLIKHNRRKEYFCLFGDKSVVGPVDGEVQTDGILTAMNAFAAANAGDPNLVGLYNTYSGPAGTNRVDIDDINTMIDRAQENNGDPSNFVLMMSKKPIRTVSNYFDNKVQYDSPALFQHVKVPMYPYGGGGIPIIEFNANNGFVGNDIAGNPVNNILTDKVVLIDVTQLRLIYTLFPFMREMPATYFMNFANTMVGEMFGLEYGDLWRFGMLDGIDAM